MTNYILKQSLAREHNRYQVSIPVKFLDLELSQSLDEYRYSQHHQHPKGRKEVCSLFILSGSSVQCLNLVSMAWGTLRTYSIAIPHWMGCLSITDPMQKWSSLVFCSKKKHWSVYGVLWLLSYLMEGYRDIYIIYQKHNSNTRQGGLFFP